MPAVLRGFFTSLALFAALVLRADGLGCHTAGARRPPRQRHQPRHRAVRRGPDRPRERGRLQRRRHRARHARRPLRVDAGHREEGARVGDSGRRLRRARRRARGLGRRLDRPGGGHPRHGAADEPRLVDADLDRRRGHPEGPPAQGDQRRGGTTASAREGARAQREVGGCGRPGRLEPQRARGALDERHRRHRHPPSPRCSTRSTARRPCRAGSSSTPPAPR